MINCPQEHILTILELMWSLFLPRANKLRPLNTLLECLIVHVFWEKVNLSALQSTRDGNAHWLDNCKHMGNKSVGRELHLGEAFPFLLCNFWLTWNSNVFNTSKTNIPPNTPYEQAIEFKYEAREKFTHKANKSLLCTETTGKRAKTQCKWSFNHEINVWGSKSSVMRKLIICKSWR